MAATQLPINFYELLGVAPSATTEEIRAAYRVRISQYHPDRNRWTHAGAVAALINEAWEVLGNPERRRVYDASAILEASHSRTNEAGSTAYRSDPPTAPAAERPPSAAPPTRAKLDDGEILTGALVLVAIIAWVGWMGWVSWSVLVYPLIGIVGGILKGTGIGQWEVIKRKKRAGNPDSSVCPQCGRKVPHYIEQCRCGFKRPDADTSAGVADDANGHPSPMVHEAMNMRTLCRWLFGYRDDVDLFSRWWHRGFVILFVLVMVLMTFLAWALQPYAPSFQSSNLVIITNLEDYTYAHPEMENAVKGFVSAAEMTAKRTPLLPDPLGIREHNGEMSSYFISEYQWFCNADFPSHVEGFRRWARLSSGSEVDTATATHLLSEIVTPQACLTLTSLGDHPSAKDVLRVKYTDRALRQMRDENTFRTVLISLGIALILLNVYYRAFIYIIFGKRRN